MSIEVHYASPSTACITETDIVADIVPDLFDSVGLLEGDVHLETDPTVSPTTNRHCVEWGVKLYSNQPTRVAIQITLQTTEAALDFKFDHFIVIILASGKSLQ